jgi:4-hydroxy-tetrahydrodipicolinate synthase
MTALPPLAGTYVALVTPFKSDLSFDEDAYRRLIEHAIAGGVEGLVPCGTTGEKSTLSTDEHKAVIDAAIAIANGRVRVIAGTGSNDTAHAAEMAAFAKSAGADAALSVAPYYNKPTQEGLFRHSAFIAEHADCPIIVYNVPGRTSNPVKVETIVRLMDDPRIAGVKDATGDMDITMEIVRAARPDFTILSGDDSRTLAMIAVGAHGVISVVANETPAEMSDLVRAALAGDYETARELQYRLLDLMGANFIESNPIPAKYALVRMGLIEENYRLPLCPMSDASRPAMDEVLRGVGLIE